MMRLFAAILLLTGLVACGPAGERDSVLAPLQSGITGIFRPGPRPSTAASVRAALTPAARASLGNRPLKIAVLERRNQASVLIENTRNRDVVTYLTPDGVSVSLRQGVLVATRGLGFDLMTADVDAVLPALRGGGQGVVRVHRYLDGEEQVVIRSFICDYTGRGTVTETCHSDGFKITNSYQLGGGGIIASRQWVSPEQGYLRLEPAE